MTRTTRIRPSAAIAAPLLAVVLVLSGCASDDSGDANATETSAPDPSATSSAGTPEISAEFSACLEEQGVALPSEQPTDATMPSMDPQMQEALQACASLAPSDGLAGVPGEIDQSALDAFADCMGENDVEVEATVEAVTALDQSNKKVNRALDTCAALIQR